MAKLGLRDTRTMMMTLVAGAMIFGCAADNAEEATMSDASELQKKEIQHSLKSVALGRLFQHDEWVIRAAGDDREKRIDYACKAFAKLDPTYVSGLVRVDADEKILPEVVATYRGVRDCVRRATKGKVMFDIVLNARHYGSADVLRDRLREVKEAFDPDVVFFDFFADPWNVREWDKNRGAMAAGIDWIHEHGMLAAGNVQLSDKDSTVPPKSDFVAVKFGNQGFDAVKKQLDKIRDAMPVLMHIQNDPQIPDSAGLKFLADTPAQRRDIVDDHARRADGMGYSYMFPIFFPLKQVKKEGKPTETFSYDAVDDGLLPRMATLAKKD